MHHPTGRITHTTAFFTPVVGHWLEREIAQWVHPMKDRSDDPSHYERTLLRERGAFFKYGTAPLYMKFIDDLSIRWHLPIGMFNQGSSRGYDNRIYKQTQSVSSYVQPATSRAWVVWDTCTNRKVHLE